MPTIAHSIKAMPAHQDVRHVAETILDRLPVTDKHYFHLESTSPLVWELARRVQAAQPPPARVLLIGPDTLLPLTLLQLGYEVDLWQFSQAFLTDDLTPHIQRQVTPAELPEAAAQLPCGGYDVVVAPLILESLTGEPLPFIRALRWALQPAGSLILATTNVSRLSSRLLALRGGNPRHGLGPTRLSLSWPSLPHQRYFHRDELLALAPAAGLRVRSCDFVIAHKIFTGIDRFSPGEFGGRQGAHALMRLLPPTRHVIVVDFSPRLGDAPTDEPAQQPLLTSELPADSLIEQELPYLSIILAGDDEALLRPALMALIEQDYPPERYEVIALHQTDAANLRSLIDEFAGLTQVAVRGLAVADVEGPVARDAAMAVARGSICAHTDGAAQVPAAWLRTIVAAFDETTGVVGGPVLDRPGSHPPFLVLPGSRPTAWPHRGLFPIYNVAYRRSVALAAGGFTGAIATADAGAPLSPYPGDSPPVLFWDTEFAYRVQRLGWKARFDQGLIAFRLFRPPARLTWLAEQWRQAQELPVALTRVPELRRPLLSGGLFLGKETACFELAVLALVALLVRRERRWLLLALPWLVGISQYAEVWPHSRWRPSLRLLIGLTLRHLIWSAGLLRGSVKARRAVL